jgi:hypothetical protein
MTAASPALKSHLHRVFATADRHETPFRYWLLADVLPAATARAVTALPFAPPEVGDSQGRRETHNASRIFFAADKGALFPVVDAVAAAFQDDETVDRIESCFGLSLAGSFLRIEYCQDTEGFWLEPHTDISAKLFTMLVYLSSGPEAEDWGTDLYDAALHPAGRSPGGFNKGLIFRPAGDTWHGYAKRPMRGIRKSLIINYVKADWRARQELCFPDRPCLA